jgi:hypothetical protein
MNDDKIAKALRGIETNTFFIAAFLFLIWCQGCK